MKRVCLWMLAGLMLLLAGCATEDAVGRGVQDVSLTVDDVPNRWTYVSLSAHEDALWMMRTDWDVAFCNGMIRTNSGSSGKGKGGITWTPVDYDDIENLRAPSYQTDTRQTVTVKSVEIE